LGADDSDSDDDSKDGESKKAKDPLQAEFDAYDEKLADIVKLRREQRDKAKGNHIHILTSTFITHQPSKDIQSVSFCGGAALSRSATTHSSYQD
jgi:hypothetical protein